MQSNLRKIYANRMISIRMISLTFNNICAANTLNTNLIQKHAASVAQMKIDAALVRNGF